MHFLKIGSGYSINLNSNNGTIILDSLVIADKVEVMNSIKVGNNLVLKSDSSRSISGFTMINASSVLTPFVLAEEIIFYENFGLTISGELLMSTTAPLRIGGWNFPSLKPPKLNAFNLSRVIAPRQRTPSPGPGKGCL